MNAVSHITSQPAKSGSPAPMFTAAQIAAVLGIKRQSVQGQLCDIAPAAVRIVHGNQAAAWTVDQLPLALRERLAASATKQGCRTIEAVLSMPRQQWQPSVPLDKLADDVIKSATKLRDALRTFLARQHDPNQSSAEMEAQGVDEYRRIFGNRITARYWRELFMRTVRRDNGFEEWNRLEIYLPDRLTLKDAPAAAVSAALAEDFEELAAYILGCSNPHAPTKKECEGVWTLALQKVVSLVNTGETEKAAARRVRRFLFDRAAFLAPSRDGLWVTFKRKIKALEREGGDIKALRDRREDNGPKFELPENDRDALVHRSVVYYRGDIAPAWRDLLRSGFSPAVVDRYAGKAVNKSHVPSSVMDSVAPEVELLTAMHQGPRAFDAIKGHVTRSYEGISSLQCISGDDFTMNTYFYIPDGKGWFELTRGQVILFIDLRSLRILGWALEPAKSYSSLTIRSLCTHVFGEFGVPEVLYFERGIWKNATLLKGKTDPFGFTEISQGLREYGITFKHAIRPRTKAVERVGGLFQDLAEAEPGYCGRDERRDAPESLRKQMAEVADKNRKQTDAVESRNVHPSKYFYSYDQWNDRIRNLVEQYNAEVQQGHILAGMSPDQAFEAYMNKENPPKQFHASLRYLLAHDKRIARVTLNGVTIQIGKNKFNYRGQTIAHLVGREVLVWFDPENPEIVTVTNPDRTNPICVTRSQNPNVLESIIDPDSGTLGRELARIEAQASYTKTRYNVLKTKFPMPQRQLLLTAQTNRSIDLGAKIAAGKSDITERQAQTRRRMAANKDKARRQNIPPALVDEGEQSRRAMELLGDIASPRIESESETT